MDWSLAAAISLGFWFVPDGSLGQFIDLVTGEGPSRTALSPKVLSQCLLQSPEASDHSDRTIADPYPLGGTVSAHPDPD